MNKILEDPGWRGEREAGSGADRKTTKAQDKELVKYTCANRGEIKVTVHHLRTVFAWLHGLSDSLVEDRLRDADMWWLRRRSKFSVTKKYIRERIAYCRTTLTKQQRTLDLWAFTDGTVFYLDRTEEENEHTQRAALGKFCWRRSDSREAMYQECLGPSSHKKAQGHPVRVWVLLAEGRLHIHVLEAGEALRSCTPSSSKTSSRAGLGAAGMLCRILSEPCGVLALCMHWKPCRWSWYRVTPRARRISMRLRTSGSSFAKN